MAYEHKTTEAVDAPEVRWFTVSPPSDEDFLGVPNWNFGAAEDLTTRSYEFHKGDRRFIQQKYDIGMGTALVVYANRKVMEDGKRRLVSKVELESGQVVWTVLEP